MNKHGITFSNLPSVSCKPWGGWCLVEMDTMDLPLAEQTSYQILKPALSPMHPLGWGEGAKNLTASCK